MIDYTANAGDEIWIEFPTYNGLYTAFAEDLRLSMASKDTFKQIQCSIAIALVPTYSSSIDVCYLYARTSLTQSSPATIKIILTSSIIPTNYIRIILPYILNPSLLEVNSLDLLSKSSLNAVTMAYSFVLSTKLNTTTK